MKKTKKAIVFGTGSFAEIVYFYLMNDSEYDVVAFSTSNEDIKYDKKFDLPIVLFRDVHNQYNPKEYEMYIAVGYSNLNKFRTKFYNEAKKKGYKLLSYISTKATVLTSHIGDNCFILEDNTLQPFLKIGNNVVVWSGNHLGHHSIIEDNCFISSHAIISGHCRVKQYTFIGVNATIKDNIIIEKENIIGAGSLILKNTKVKEVYVAEKTRVFPKTSDKMKL